MKPIELTTQQLSLIVIIIGVIITIHLAFTVWSYYQLRNKQGPAGPQGPPGPRGPPGPSR